MSAFLGQIHYWLYNKIQLVNEREQQLYEQAAETCGSTAEELRSVVWQTYGEPLPDLELEKLIDHSNIHGWLQRQINLAESREAGLIKELLDMCGDQTSLINSVFVNHGRLCGERAQKTAKYDVESAPGLFKALGDYRLTGMPCDQADEVTIQQADKVAWQSKVVLSAANWKRAGMGIRVMQAFQVSWLSAFVAALNPAFSCQQTLSMAAGDPVDCFEIVLK